MHVLLLEYYYKLCVILQGELLSKIREQILLCDQVIKSVSENCYNKLEHCSTIF